MMDQLNISILQNKEKFSDFLLLYNELQDKKPSKKVISQLQKDIFLKNSPLEVILAYLDKEPIGLMIVIQSYSSTLAKKTFYLEEFYIRKEKQGMRFGKKLFQYLIDFSRRQKVARIEWSTRKTNKKAKKFYKNYNIDNDWIFYKLKV